VGLQAEDLPVSGQRIAPTLIRVFYYLGLSAATIAFPCRLFADRVFVAIEVLLLSFIDARGGSELLVPAFQRYGTPRPDMCLLIPGAGRAVPMGEALLGTRI
jgi:hypothetical protein